MYVCVRVSEKRLAFGCMCAALRVAKRLCACSAARWHDLQPLAAAAACLLRAVTWLLASRAQAPQPAVYSPSQHVLAPPSSLPALPATLLLLPQGPLSCCQSASCRQTLAILQVRSLGRALSNRLLLVSRALAQQMLTQPEAAGCGVGSAGPTTALA